MNGQISFRSVSRNGMLCRCAPALGLLIAVLTLLPVSANAQDLGALFSDELSLSRTSLTLIGGITLLSIVPGLLIMITCFPFVVTVLSILRQALGLQQSPPGMVIVSLALFLTYYVMDPVFHAAWEAGLEPMVNDQLPVETALARAMEPFRRFMSAQTDPNTFAELAVLRAGDAIAPALGSEAPLSLLVPSFLLSEIERAFQIGFLIFLPFLIIDLVVAAILMSMGMMMVPPAMVALPFKLAFFVVADGWTLLSSALVRSYG